MRVRALLGALLGVLLASTPALAARVVDVRVGEHLEHSRLVFELDDRAGYRVDRCGPDWLVVSIAAELGRTPTGVHRVARAAAVRRVEARVKGARECEIQRMLGVFQALSSRKSFNKWQVCRTLVWCR